MDFLTPSTVLNLTSLRLALERMEDTIVFGFIERSQYAQLPLVYEHKSFLSDGFQGSFLDYHFMQVEELQLRLRRYEAPDENPFHLWVPRQSFMLPRIEYPKILSTEKDACNVNKDIIQYYINELVPKISAPGDLLDTWGSVLLADITLLQAISRRIHLGRFVAEAKYASNKKLYVPLILQQNVTAIGDSITNKAQEDLVVARVTLKAQQYGTAPGLNSTAAAKVNPQVVATAYRRFIELTKDVEVKYLLGRLQSEDAAEVEKYKA